MAWLSWRLPSGSRRWRSVRPELTGIGAQAPSHASCASLLNRSIPDLADQLRGDQRPDAGFGQQLGRHLAHEVGELGLQRVDRAGELADAADHVGGDPDPHGRLGSLQPPRDLHLPAGADQRPLGDPVLRPQIVELPAQLVDQPRARVDQALTMHDQQPDLELRPAQSRCRQGVQPLAQGCARNRQRVDRIRLPALPHAATGVGHQTGREPDHRLAVIEQEPLKRPGHVPAILNHPSALGVQPARPGQQLAEPLPPRRPRGRGQLHPQPIDRNRRMRPLVRIDSDRQHLSRSFGRG